MFNEKFKKDEAGKARNWPDVEEGKIKELFDVCKAQITECLDQFKLIILPKNVTTFELIQEGTPDGEQISRDDLEFAMGQEMVKMKRTSSLSNTRLLTEEEINRVRDKFAEDIDFVYEEAIARHVSELNCIFLEEYYFHEHPNLLLDFVCLVCFGQHYELSFKSHFVLPTGCSLCLLDDCLSAWSFADPDGSWLPSRKASSERSFGQNTHPIQNLTA
jgi:hypothetical protein